MDNHLNSVFLGPGIKMMQKYKFLHKILILIVIMLIPITMLFYFLHGEIKKVADFADGERNGIQYILPLSEILIELTAEISPEFASPKIEEKIKIIEKNDEKLGAQLKTTPRWNELKGLLQQHTPGTRQVAIDKTLELITTVGDNSGLVLDPDLDSYYIMDAGVVKYPEILRKTNQLSALAVKNLGKTSKTVDEQIQMAMVEGAIHSTLAGVKTGIQTAVKANATLKDSALAFTESDAATTTLIKQVDNALLQTNTSVVSSGRGQEIMTQLKESNNKSGMAYRLSLKQLDELLVIRINTVVTHEKNIFMGMVLALIIASYLLVALYRSMKESIMAIFAGTKEFATGDWREGISISSTDEFADISISLNSVREKMRPMITNILHSAQQLSASSEELTISSEQVAQSSNHVYASVAQVAIGAEQQLQAVHKSITAIEQMSDSIRQVATNTSLATHSSEQTAEAARKGTVAIKTAMEQMTNIEISVIDSASVVKNLGERSQEIGQIVDTISAIAGQTNLLALNAAIEAARAGEQGRGFAVVAEEVRKLAEQSQEAAKQIATLIAEIQSQTGKAVDAMQSGTKIVKIGTETVNSAGEAFNEIAKLIYQVAGQVNEVSMAMQNIVSGNQEMVLTANEIANTTKEAVSETQNVSAASQEQSASMQEIASSSQALSKLAEKLQNVVNFFKV